MPAEVIVHGREEVIDGLKHLESDAAKLEEPSRRAAAGLIPVIRSRTPVRTGALGVSWDVGTAPGGASVTSPLHYAWPIESGTRRGVEPHHMVRDALRDQQAEVVDAYRDAIASDAAGLGFRVDR
jgi:hypothetical protein